ncbi:hypothetical protein DFQ01_13441 [Paenibacillus cellulosilyticus]|uniref:Paeninodin family lasso peptide n=1 Tax=Paenibacillus cellulosilyticus TaxID=375489 RepID=A0A2V2YKK6_9BACL|nr:paeninodin family lasso peptide [Paenibacillus cellulosilyticus]PWV93802.1 hypothetical protein DFQ01_13441 [Paenibacillus cellulosilyticus]QKS47417.1 paeninodin family lasso peptide [Paenibacillus cellulosilyticus]
MSKKNWQAPVVEALEISETMAGAGTKYIDYFFTDKGLELDITDAADPGSTIYGPAPTVTIS